MATARPFAYNPGSPIPGTQQLGDLAVGFPDGGFTNDPQFWNGPDEELGYTIALPVSGNTQPTPIPGVTASVRFIRSNGVTEESFIGLVNTQFGQNFESGNEAKIWLDSQGYWSSWSGFGSSGFQWMTMTSITDSNAAGIGQNNVTVAITQSEGGMQIEDSGMYNATTFPETYGVPVSGIQIRNTLEGVFTATFSTPVTDALVAFASVGNPNLPVPVDVSAPFTPIWHQPGTTTYANNSGPSQFTRFIGQEGFNIIRIDGTVTEISFNYTVPEYYCTICFGFVDQNA
jgi:hypothetical protein